ncbi:hypothetical protein ACO0RG_001790 [Hanseniaspora osmophila]
MIFPGASKAKHLNAPSLHEEQTGCNSDRCVCNGCVFVRKSPFVKLYFYGLLIPLLWVYLVLLCLAFYVFTWKDSLKNYGIALPPEIAFPTVFQAQEHMENNCFSLDPEISDTLASNSHRINGSNDTQPLERTRKSQLSVELNDLSSDAYPATTEGVAPARARHVQENMFKEAVLDIVESHFACESVVLRWAMRALASICCYCLLTAMIFLSIRFKDSEGAY